MRLKHLFFLLMINIIMAGSVRSETVEVFPTDYGIIFSPGFSSGMTCAICPLDRYVGRNDIHLLATVVRGRYQNVLEEYDLSLFPIKNNYAIELHSFGHGGQPAESISVGHYSGNGYLEFSDKHSSTEIGLGTHFPRQTMRYDITGVVKDYLNRGEAYLGIEFQTGFPLNTGSSFVFFTSNPPVILASDDDLGSIQLNDSANPVPLPSSLLLLLSCFSTLFLKSRKKSGS